MVSGRFFKFHPPPPTIIPTIFLSLELLSSPYPISKTITNNFKITQHPEADELQQKYNALTIQAAETR